MFKSYLWVAVWRMLRSPDCTAVIEPISTNRVQMNTQQDDTVPAPESAPEVKPLPKGYLWRVIVIVALFLSGGICMFFVNSILGAILFLCGVGFAKFSRLHELEAEVMAQNAQAQSVGDQQK